MASEHIAEHCAAHDDFVPACVHCRWRAATADRDTLLRAIAAEGAAGIVGLTKHAVARRNLHDTAKAIRERCEVAAERRTP